MKSSQAREGKEGVTTKLTLGGSRLEPLGREGGSEKGNAKGRLAFPQEVKRRKESKSELLMPTLYTEITCILAFIPRPQKRQGRGMAKETEQTSSAGTSS